MLGIQTNVASLMAQRNLGKGQIAAQAASARLSSGHRVNGAKDDAAGLAIAESMRAQARSMRVCERNTQDGISMVQTAEGALGEVSNMIVRMRELATQAANGALGARDRWFVQSEFAELQEEIRRVFDSTKFNGKGLFAAPSPGSLPAAAEVYTVGTPETGAVQAGLFHQHVGTDHLHSNLSDGETMWSPTTDTLVIHGAGGGAGGGSSAGVTEAFQVGVGNTADDRVDVNFDRPALSELFGVPVATVDASTVVRFFDGTHGNLEASSNQWSSTSPPSPLTAGILDADAFNDPSADIVGRTVFADGAGGGGGATAPACVATAEGARAALDALDASLKAVSEKRAYFGSMLNRFDAVVSNLQTQRINLTASESRIRDADIATESADQARAQVLTQAGTSVLAQANQGPQQALTLLRG